MLISDMVRMLPNEHPLLVAVVHTAVPQDAGPEEQDTLVQAEYAASLARSLGFEAVLLPIAEVKGTEKSLEDAATGSALRQGLAKTGASVVVNLVEGIGGSARDAHLVPQELHELGVSYTGSSAHALLCSTNKLMAKQILRANCLPTPSVVNRLSQAAQERMTDVCIVKSVWEHASLGLDAGSVLKHPTGEELAKKLAERCQRFGGEWFAEEFIPGRELNISLLETPQGVSVLPPAEIVFGEWDEERPQIVDFAAKWNEDDAAFKNTNRSFRFAEKDNTILNRARQLALDCWKAFGLEGYARVDMRVDSLGGLWVIDINANPCLSPDAGFIAAAKEAELQPGDVMEYLLLAAMQRSAKLRHRVA